MPRRHGQLTVSFIFWSFWALVTAVTTWLAISEFQNQETDSSWGFLIWLPIAYAGTIGIPLQFLACHSNERVVFGRESYEHVYTDHTWWFPCRCPISNVTALVMGRPDSESEVFLFVRYRGRPDALSWWSTLEFQRELFNHIAQHLESIDSPVQAVEDVTLSR